MMKVLLFLTPMSVFMITACSSASPGFTANLNKNAMNFNQEGADFGECGLVSQFEKGRASASQAAGGG